MASLFASVYFFDAYLFAVLKKKESPGLFPSAEDWCGIALWTAAWITGGLMVSPLPHAHLACCQLYYI